MKENTLNMLTMKQGIDVLIKGKEAGKSIFKDD